MTRRRWFGGWANGCARPVRRSDRCCSARRIGCRRCGRWSSVSSIKRARASSAATRTSPDKVLSLFEPHTVTIRKGKIAKPNEFGNLVTIQEAEHQIVTALRDSCGATGRRHVVDPGVGSASGDLRPRAGSGRRRPRLQLGQATNRRRSTAACDAWSCRGSGPKSPARRAYERQRWFRRGQRWRVGCEGRISVLKRRHGLRRCRYHGVDGMHRWVGFGVIADNLMNIATFTKARATA